MPRWRERRRHMWMRWARRLRQGIVVVFMSIISLLLLLVVRPTDGNDPRIQQDVLAQLKADAVREWRGAAQRISDGAFAAHGTTETTIGKFKQEGEDVNLRTAVSFDVCLQPSRSLSLVRRRSGGQVSVAAMNDRYGFEILSKREEPFVLRGVAGSSEKRSKVLHAHEEYRWYLCAGYYAWYETPAWDLLDDERFQVTRAERLVSGEHAGRVYFEAMPRAGKEGARDSRHWIIVNPEALWRIEECGINNNRRKASLSLRSRFEGNATPFPAAVTKLRKSSDPQLVDFDRTAIRIESVAPCDCDTEEFYLPYYGIPESVLGAAKASVGVRRTWLAAGFGGLVLAIVLWIVARKRQSTAQ